MQNQKNQKYLVSKVIVLFAAVFLMFVGVQVFAADAATNLGSLQAPKQPLTFTSDEEAGKLPSVVQALKVLKADQNLINILTEANVDVSTDSTDTNSKKVIIKAKAAKSDVVTGELSLNYVVGADKGVAAATPFYKSWWFLTLLVVTVVAVASGVVFFVKKNKKN
uniref:Immunodominant membrane protein n=2 Tax=Candidatus Phytoplasma TaxID=33926 RepID=Q9AIR6_9MOLU|nr:immunodominant membrane protein precursor [Clover phyllody phytoplasma]BAE93546.1 Antigenic membrane protein [Potato purple top phytoplasma]